MAIFGSNFGANQHKEIDEKLAVDGDDFLEIIFDCWTALEARGNGLSSWTLRYLADHLAEEGQTAWYYCMSRSLQSQQGIEKAGFTLYRAISSPYFFRGRKLPTPSLPCRPLSLYFPKNRRDNYPDTGGYLRYSAEDGGVLQGLDSKMHIHADRYSPGWNFA